MSQYHYSFEGWNHKFTQTEPGNTFVPVSGLVYKKITDTDYRLCTPMVPSHLTQYHFAFTNGLSRFGFQFLEIGPTNPQLMNEQGSLLSKQIIDSNGYSWRYFEDGSTLYWDGHEWVKNNPSPPIEEGSPTASHDVEKESNFSWVDFFINVGKVIIGIFTILAAIVTMANKLQSGSWAGQNNQAGGSTIKSYTCLCGNIEHASRYTGHRKCSRCGKPMQFRH